MFKTLEEHGERFQKKRPGVLIRFHLFQALVFGSVLILATVLSLVFRD